MEFKNKIKKYLADTLCVEYTGDLEYDVSLEDEYYSLIWYLNPEDNRPLILQGTFPTEEDFYQFVIREIKNKRFHVFKNFRAIKIVEADQPVLDDKFPKGNSKNEK